MVRAIIGTVVLALAGLFGYYYFTDSSNRTGQERARDAGLHVFDTAKDTAAGGAIKTQLTAALGMDASRLLHVWYDDGNVIVYGLAPDGVDEARIRGVLSGTPGLTNVEILVQPRPGYVSTEYGASGPAPAGGPKSPETRQP